MKKIFLAGIIGLAGVAVQAGIIWNFDTPASMPASIEKFGYIYVDTNSAAAGKGIQGSKALELTIPARTRSWGGGLALVPAKPINLASPSTTAWVYVSVAADAPNPFGISLEVSDNSGGNAFIPSPGPYAASGQKLAGKIKPAFQTVAFDLRTFDRYGAATGKPNLAAITKIRWIFPDNTPGATGPLHIYLDNVGASTNAPVPVELTAPKPKQK